MGYENFTSSALSPGGFVLNFLLLFQRYFDEACIVFDVNILDEILVNNQLDELIKG